MSAQPPGLPVVVPGALQQNFDKLNLRLWAVEGKFDAAKVTGSKGGNEAIASLLSALAEAGLITDETT